MRYPVFLVALLGCTNPFGRNCTADVHPAIAVDVRASATGDLLAEGAAGVLRDGAYVDSLRPWKLPNQLGGAFERPGIYSVEIQRPGYAVWQRTGVRAQAGSCHVQTVTIRADLVPEP